MKKNLAALAALTVLPSLAVSAPAVASEERSLATAAVVATFATRGAHVWRVVALRDL
jgi:predicted component of type VI protein secretion system